MLQLVRNERVLAIKRVRSHSDEFGYIASLRVASLRVASL
jgi:hypothetical protein